MTAQKVNPQHFECIYPKATPSLVRNEEQVVLGKVREMAMSVIQGQSPETCGDVHIHNHYHNDGWWWWCPWPSYHETIVVDNRSERERNRDGAVILGIAFAAIALVTSYFLGRDYSRSSDASENLEEVNNMRNRLWSYARNETAIEPHLPEVDDVLSRTQRIFSRQLSHAHTGLALKASLVAASALGIVGCIAMAGPLMIAGGVAVAATSAGMLFRWGASRTEQKNLADAEAVYDDTRRLQAELC